VKAPHIGNMQEKVIRKEDRSVKTHKRRKKNHERNEAYQPLQKEMTWLYILRRDPIKLVVLNSMNTMEQNLERF
jgi:hypothetical protein